MARLWRGSSNNTVGGNDAMTTRKMAWYTTTRTNFKEALGRYERHVAGRHVGSTCLCNKCDLLGNQCPVRADRLLDYRGKGLGFPAGSVYEDPVAVVGKDDKLGEKSPAEIIAEARKNKAGSGPDRGGRTPEPPRPRKTLSKSVSVPAILPSNHRAKKKHPLMARGPAAPSGLLAAIAARRID